MKRATASRPAIWCSAAPLTLPPPSAQNERLISAFQAWENGCYHPHQHAAYEERGSRGHICDRRPCLSQMCPLDPLSDYKLPYARFTCAFSTERTPLGMLRGTTSQTRTAENRLEMAGTSQPATSQIGWTLSLCKKESRSIPSGVFTSLARGLPSSPRSPADGHQGRGRRPGSRRPTRRVG